MARVARKPSISISRHEIICIVANSDKNWARLIVDTQVDSVAIDSTFGRWIVKVHEPTGGILRWLAQSTINDVGFAALENDLMVIDATKTANEIRTRIITQRKAKEITKVNARLEWERAEQYEMGDYDEGQSEGSEANFWGWFADQDLVSDVDGLVVQKIQYPWQRFWDELFAGIVQPAIKAELGESC